MRVYELIKKLQSCNQEAEIFFPVVEADYPKQRFCKLELVHEANDAFTVDRKETVTHSVYLYGYAFNQPPISALFKNYLDERFNELKKLLGA